MHGQLSRVLLAWLMICALAAQAQSSARPTSLAQSLDYLTGEKMLKELDILPSQQEKLKALRGELQAKTKEAYESIDASGLPKDDRKVLREEAQAKINDEVAREIEQALLPHQLKRLRQIMLQRRLGQHKFGGNAAAALGAEDLAEELGITEKQRDELKAKEKEVKEELEKKAKEIFRQLQDEAQQRLFEVLSPTQRQRLKEMLGEKFIWE